MKKELTKREKLPFLIGTDKLRLYLMDRIRDWTSRKDENTTRADIIESLPEFDMPEYLNDDTKDVVEQAGYYARAFNQDVLGVTHLLYALVDNPAIDEILVRNGINITSIDNILDKRIVKGDIPDDILRNEQVQISEDVQQLLEDSMEESTLESTRIDPIVLFLELLKKDYPEVSKILDASSVDVSNLVETIENEISKGK